MRALDAFGKCILASGTAIALLASPGTAYARGYRVLYTFCSQKYCADGAFPRGGLIRDSAGNLYGTTSEGGGIIDRGVVFKLAPDGTETVLYTFCNCANGAFPEGGVIKDSAGNLYGTTSAGGTGCKINGGGGTVFAVLGYLTPTQKPVFIGSAYAPLSLPHWPERAYSESSGACEQVRG